MTVKDQNTKHSHKKTKGAAVREIHGSANGIWHMAYSDKIKNEEEFCEEITHTQLLLQAYSISYVLSAALMDLRMAHSLWLVVTKSRTGESFVGEDHPSAPESFLNPNAHYSRTVCCQSLYHPASLCLCSFRNVTSGQQWSLDKAMHISSRHC